MFEVTFCTSNSNKAQELQQILTPQVVVNIHKVDITEIQATSDDIVKKKCQVAYDIVRRAIIVEDTSLELKALNGLPGPYIKEFVTRIGLQGIVKLADDREATAVCVIGFFDGNMETPEIFKGEVKGSLVMPRGSEAFGWDAIFQPDQFVETFGEMDREKKNQISHRFLAAKKLKEYLLARYFSQ